MTSFTQPPIPVPSGVYQSPAASVNTSFIPNGYNGLSTLVPNLRASVATSTDSQTPALGGTLVCLGDSTTRGASGGDINTQSWPAQLRQLMNSYLCPAVQGLGMPFYNDVVGADADSRFTIGTGWTGQTNGFAQNGCIGATTGTSGNLVFTPGLDCDTLDVVFISNTGFGTVTPLIDGVPTTPIAAGSGVTFAMKKQTFTFTPGSGHVFTFPPPVGGQFQMAYVDAYLSNGNAVRVSNIGVPSSTSATWATSGFFSSLQTLQLLAPKTTIIALGGVNDAVVGNPLSTLEANIAAIIAICRLSGDVILVSAFPSETGQSPDLVPLETAYSVALPSFAAAQGAPGYDLFGRWGSWAAANAVGMITDPRHPNYTVGYPDGARGIYSMVASLVG